MSKQIAGILDAEGINKVVALGHDFGQYPTYRPYSVELQIRRKLQRLTSPLDLRLFETMSLDWYNGYQVDRWSLASRSSIQTASSR